jgi:predicted nucleic acid-binding protein
MRFVLDNSVLVAWAFDEDSSYADGIGGGLAERRAIVPAIWPLEFGNTLLAAERRGRVSGAQAARVRDQVLSLAIEVVPDHPPRVLTDVLALARQQGLTVYDAAYLDLAVREGVPLATLDGALAAAARRVGVALVEA